MGQDIAKDFHRQRSSALLSPSVQHQTSATPLKREHDRSAERRCYFVLIFPEMSCLADPKELLFSSVFGGGGGVEVVGDVEEQGGGGGLGG